MKTNPNLFVMAALFSLIACTGPGAENIVNPDPGTTQSGVVKGKVVDSQGKPLAKAEVVATSANYVNDYSLGYSDANGNYAINLSTGPMTGTYYVRGTINLKVDGQSYRLPLFTEDDGTFTPAEGAVKNLRLKLSGERTGNFGDDGYYGGTVEVNNHTDANYVQTRDIELILTPVSLFDGSPGETVRAKPNGLYIQDVPLGRYTIRARQASTGRALTVRIRTKDQDYQSAVTGFFEAPFQGSERYQMDVEVSN